MEKHSSRSPRRISVHWSNTLAYSIGLITSDGCLLNDGRHIDFTSKDREQVETFKRCLGLKVKTGKKRSGYMGDKYYFRAQFGDVVFYRWLQDIGLKPNKSKTLTKLNIPNKYFLDFLRGFFDGDGSIYAYWDPRWHSSYMFYISFASGSKPFLEWLNEKINKQIFISGKITPMAGAYQLRFAKTTSRLLFDKMYYSDKIPFLKRKFTKAQKIIKIDERHNAQVEELVDSRA